MSHHPNIELLERVVDALGELTEQLVFLGGSITTSRMRAFAKQCPDILRRWRVLAADWSGCSRDCGQSLRRQNEFPITARTGEFAISPLLAEKRSCRCARVPATQVFHYLYDFGVYWMHRIEVEDTAVIADPGWIPWLIDGARRGPLENCGGTALRASPQEAELGR